MKTLAIIVLAVGLSACSTTHRMDIYDMRYMQADCANKEAQIRFLETQMTSPMDRVSSLSNFAGILGLLSMKSDGSAGQHRAIVDREYDSIAKRLIWELRTNC